MINPRICSKCPHGKVDEPLYEDGEKMKLWSVECSKADSFGTYHMAEVLMIKDKPPKKCPYILEHQISMQNVDKDEIKYLSQFP
jgi:hypothetical protein